MLLVTVVLVAIAAYLCGVETHLTCKELELVGFIWPFGQYVSQHRKKNLQRIGTRSRTPTG
jgi:hypothetical protein